MLSIYRKVAQMGRCSFVSMLFVLSAGVLAAAVAVAAQQSQSAQSAQQSTQQNSTAASQSKPQPANQAPNQAATNQQTPKLTSQSKLVYVNAVVRDKKGKVIPTLNKEDFVVEEDGRPQTITNFIRESDLPLTLGLLVDTSMSQRGVIDDERDASYKFLDQMLRPDKDKAFVLHFDHEVELLRDLTADRAKLKSALDELQIASYERTSDNGDEGDSGDEGGGHHHGGTQLYDAIYLASNELMKKQQGRKAIFVMSDGVDRGSKESLEDAIEAAQRANTSIYSLYFAGPKENEEGGGHHGGIHMGGPGMGGPMGYPGGGYPGGGGGYPGGGGGGQGQHRHEAHVDGKKVLERISTETGGRMFEISKKLKVSDAYAQAQEDLRNQYTLGYAPDRTDAREDYHKIHLTTKQTDLTVQARDGYYSD